LLLRNMDQIVRQQRESSLGVGGESNCGKCQVSALRNGLRAPTSQKRIDGHALVQPDMPEIVAQGTSEEFDQQGCQAAYSLISVVESRSLQGIACNGREHSFGVEIYEHAFGVEIEDPDDICCIEDVFAIHRRLYM